MEEPLSLYIHIPFCAHRCAYCDFNTYAGMGHLMPSYIQALCTEIEMVARSNPERLAVHTVFFGGGTPSLLTLDGIAAILDTARGCFAFLEEMEITLEANPGTLWPEYLQGLRWLGINRLSLGVQSAHPDDLRLLERQHNYFDVIQAVQWARKAGFKNLSLDLIYGLPGQPLSRWQTTLEHALRLNPEHLSLYALGIEEGTPFHTWRTKGLIQEPDDDQAADMYEYASEALQQGGYLQYEISNWAHINGSNGVWMCLHNLQYWRALPYLGFGAGAHGCASRVRTANVPGIAGYIRLIETVPENATLVFPVGPAAETITRLDRWTELEEAVMTSLRLTREGISLPGFLERFGLDLTDAFPGQVEDLQRLGLVEVTGGENACLRLTGRGRLLGNQVFLRFVGNPAPPGFRPS